MSAGNASAFPRIDPDDPLARAARETNAHAETHGLEATLLWLGLSAGPGEVAYLAEQRALRAIAAATLGLPDVDETVARAIVDTPLWRDMRMLLVGVFMDGCAIGWKAARDTEPLHDLALGLLATLEDGGDTSEQARALAEAVRDRAAGDADDGTPDHFEGNIGANIAGGRYEKRDE